MQILGISSDSPFALQTWADSLKITFPLLSDWPRTVIARYGVLAANKAYAYRAFFLVDQQGILRKQWLLGPAGDSIVFSSEPILKAVQDLNGKR